MAWHRPGNKPLSKSMMVSLLTHPCFTRPQLVASRTCSRDARWDIMYSISQELCTRFALCFELLNGHYGDVIMGTIAFQITSLTIVYSAVYSDADQRTSKLRVTGLCAGKSPGTGEFPAQMASNAENVSIWWRHNVQPQKIILPSWFIWWSYYSYLSP